MKSPTFLAIIPARCGSKGLPGKNLRPLLGKPLIGWSIDAALQSKYITKTIVSSDCNEVLEAAQKLGATAVRRPKELALDSSPSEPLILHAINLFESEGRKFDYIALLQPTSPLRDHMDLDRAIEQLLENDADAIISVYEPAHSPFKAFIQNDDGFLRGIYDDKTPFMRRQDLPRVFLTNGAIYIVKTELFKSTHKLFGERTLPFIMPKERSIDIDDIDDFQKAERYLTDRKRDD